MKKLFRSLCNKTEYKLWEATWKDALKDKLPGLLRKPNTATDERGNEITLDHLCGEVQWATPQTQASDIPIPILNIIRDAAEKAFLDIQPSGPLLPYHMIMQGPSEPFVQFVERLTIAIKQQVDKEYEREEVLEKMAFSNTNEQCRVAILTLSWEPPPSLHQMLKICKTKVPLMGPPPGQRTKIPHPPPKAAAAETPMDTPPAVLQLREGAPSSMRRIGPATSTGKQDIGFNSALGVKNLMSLRIRERVGRTGRMGARGLIEKTKGGA